MFYCFLSLNINNYSMKLMTNSYKTADTRVADMDTEISSYCTADTILTTNNQITETLLLYVETMQIDAERLHRIL